MDARKWLISKRECSNMTQMQIAHTISISRAHYTNIENGLRRPSPEIAQKIADVLDFDWKQFFENDHENAS